VSSECLLLISFDLFIRIRLYSVFNNSAFALSSIETNLHLILALVTMVLLILYNVLYFHRDVEQIRIALIFLIFYTVLELISVVWVLAQFNYRLFKVMLISMDSGSGISHNARYNRSLRRLQSDTETTATTATTATASADSTANLRKDVSMSVSAELQYQTQTQPQSQSGVYSVSMENTSAVSVSPVSKTDLHFKKT
jgi:hypothetical protein